MLIRLLATRLLNPTLAVTVAVPRILFNVAAEVGCAGR